MLSSGVDLDAGVVERARALTERRAAGEPLQYVTGVAGFRRLDLEVGPGVFIPRPETESVAETAMGLLPLNGALIDVGTGSGAIALAVASERPDVRVWATESSADAARWARRNIGRLELPVRLLECDLFEGLPDEMRGRFDVVVSNPPYVAHDERAILPLDVVEHEPHEALFASGDGLSDVTRVARDAKKWLKAGSWLVLEIGETQGADVLSILEDAGYVSASVSMDLTGRDRIATGRNP